MLPEGVSRAKRSKIKTLPSCRHAMCTALSYPRAGGPTDPDEVVNDASILTKYRNTSKVGKEHCPQGARSQDNHGPNPPLEIRICSPPETTFHTSDRSR